MGLYYKVTPKKLLETKNEIFVKRGIPALIKNGFEKMPMTGAAYGRNSFGDYTYSLARINSASHLETITTHICRGDKWIQIYLNVFKLKPAIESLNQLNGVDSMQFGLPPNKNSEMRLRSDDFKGMPLFNTKQHKIKSSFTERGFQRQVIELGKLIEGDLSNIDSFIRRWHELHKPLVTTWEGKTIDTVE